MKSIKKSKMRTLGNNKKDINTEMEILKKMSHRNIIKLYEIINDPGSDEIYLVMDYLPGGTL